MCVCGGGRETWGKAPNRKEGLEKRLEWLRSPYKLVGDPGAGISWQRCLSSPCSDVQCQIEHSCLSLQMPRAEGGVKEIEGSV